VISEGVVLGFGGVCATGGMLQSTCRVSMCAVVIDSFDLDLRGLGGVCFRGGVISGSTSASISITSATDPMLFFSEKLITIASKRG